MLLRQVPGRRFRDIFLCNTPKASFFPMSRHLGIFQPGIKILPVADREKLLSDILILDWCTIVEELVLNAVDAGARNVKIW